MKKSLFLILISLFILSAYLLSCTPEIPTLAGTWLEMPDPGDERLKMTMTDTEFTTEKFDSATTTYNKTMEGTYTYENNYASMNVTKADPAMFDGTGDYGSLPLTYIDDASGLETILKSYSEGATTIVNDDYTIMMGNWIAYTGGDAGTLVGTWTSKFKNTQVYSEDGDPDVTEIIEGTMQYIFNGSGGLTYKRTIILNDITFVDETTTANDVTINTTDKTFTVNDGGGSIPSGTYKYKVIGDNIIIDIYPMVGGEDTLSWCEKQ